jgi:uncharacterized RDD family membrane protein YckC
MTMTADEYVDRVLEWLPLGTPNRSQIAMELRGHITERLAGGQSLDDALRQLGEPLALAESYLTAVPLVSAPFGSRALAKLVDIALILVVMVPLICIVMLTTPREVMPLLLFIGIFGSAIVAGLYLTLSEARYGHTLGKRLFGLRVVRESGARISFGQAVVRQLPMFLQMYWIDVLFALFTERSQRAFELLSKTRVVKSTNLEGGPM